MLCNVDVVRQSLSLPSLRWWLVAPAVLHNVDVVRQSLPSLMWWFVPPAVLCNVDVVWQSLPK